MPRFNAKAAGAWHLQYNGITLPRHYTETEIREEVTALFHRLILKCSRLFPLDRRELNRWRIVTPNGIRFDAWAYGQTHPNT